jgi:hypothetical protein
MSVITESYAARLPLTVDYNKTVDELVLAGKYDHADEGVTSQAYPVTGNLILKMEAFLLSFGERTERIDGDVKFTTYFGHVTTNEILAYMDACNLRPGNTQELLSFGIEHPGVQLSQPIVALYSPVPIHAFTLIPYLYRRDEQRWLNMAWWGHQWEGFFSFLAFVKND